MKMYCIIVAVSYCAVGAAKPEGPYPRLRKAGISPSLHPESSKKFNKDFPSDGRPDVKTIDKAGYHDFKPPFPHIMSADVFDRDYVKDENGDNGEWKAQAVYDRIKLEWLKAKDSLAMGNKQLDELKAAADEAAARARDAKAESADGEAKDEENAKWRSELEKERKAAEEEANLTLEAADNNTTRPNLHNVSIAEAEAELEQEQADFDNCTKQLEEAKLKLKKAQAAFDAKKKQLAAVKAARKAHKKLEELLNETADAEADSASLRKQIKAFNAEEKAAIMDAEQKNKLHELGLKAVEELKKKIHQAEIELAKAEERLRQYRGEASQPKPEPSTTPVPNFFSNLYGKLR